MAHFKSLLRGAGLGAGLMYLYDPDRGNRRRALLRDQINHLVNCTAHYFDTAGRDLSNRLAGVQAEMGAMLMHDDADDRVIVERVRSRMGRHVSHPHAIRVESHDGHIVLSGPILADEVDGLLCAVKQVRGVRELQNRLEVYASAENVPALQGGVAPPGERYDLMQENWSPATRLVMGSLGGVLMANCLAKRTPGALLLGTLGFVGFLRAATNQSAPSMAGGARGRRQLGFSRTLHVDAPVERVFDLISDFEGLPRFVNNVRRVQNLGGDRFRWTVIGPAGVDIDLEDEITETLPNEKIAWRSVPGSRVGYEGAVRFQRQGEGTRLDVHFAYNPPGGALTDAVAGILGSDPQHQMQQALLRIKTFLETGNVPHDAAARHEHPAHA
jgi:uncharacterized membrane protein